MNGDWRGALLIRHRTGRTSPITASDQPSPKYRGAGERSGRPIWGLTTGNSGN